MLAKDFKCDSKTWDDLFKVSKGFKGEIKRPDELSSWDTKELREFAKIKIAIFAMILLFVIQIKEIGNNAIWELK